MRTNKSRREFIHRAGIAGTGVIAAAHPLSGVAAQQARPAARMTMGARFRALVQAPALFECIGVHDVLTARLVELNGFPSVFVRGSSVASNGHALQDNGLVSTVELIE